MIVLALPAYRHGENPYTTLLYRQLELQGHQVLEWTVRRSAFRRYDVFHIHWPDAYVDRRSVVASLLSAVAVIALVVLARLRGAAVVWTVHNLRGHDNRHPRIEATMKRIFVRHIDGVICMSEVSAHEVREAWPALEDVPITVAHHGELASAYPDPGGRIGARAALGLAEEVVSFVFVGQLRRYKNVPSLIRAFRGLDGGDFRLTIAGPAPDPEVLDEVAALAGGDPRIDLRPRFLDADTLATLVAAADAVVLPFDAVLNSGAAVLALSLHTRVVVPRTPTFDELGRLVGIEWVRTFTPPLTSAVLSNAVARAPQARPDLSALSWGEVGRSTVDLYTRAIARRRS